MDRVSCKTNDTLATVQLVSNRKRRGINELHLGRNREMMCKHLRFKQRAFATTCTIVLISFYFRTNSDHVTSGFYVSRGEHTFSPNRVIVFLFFLNPSRHHLFNFSSQDMNQGET